MITGNPICLQLLQDPTQQRPGRPDFFNTRHHGQQDGERTVGTGPGQRPQLRFEQVLPPQAIPDAPEAQKRVFFLLTGKAGRFLVAANVQRPDDDRLSCHLLQHLAIGRQLHLLIRRRLPVQEEKFRPEQTDALTVVVADELCLVRRRDIAEQAHCAAVCQRCSPAPECLPGRPRRRIPRLRCPVLR